MRKWSKDKILEDNEGRRGGRMIGSDVLEGRGQ